MASNITEVQQRVISANEGYRRLSINTFYQIQPGFPVFTQDERGYPVLMEDKFAKNIFKMIGYVYHEKHGNWLLYEYKGLPYKVSLTDWQYETILHKHEDWIPKVNIGAA